jgi:predicted ester cyclase
MEQRVLDEIEDIVEKRTYMAKMLILTLGHKNTPARTLYNDEATFFCDAPCMKKLTTIKDLDKFYTNFYHVLPDLNLTIQETISQGKRVVVACEEKGTHVGSAWEGIPPSEKETSYRSTNIVTFEEGENTKVSRIEKTWDQLHVYQELGWITKSGS